MNVVYKITILLLVASIGLAGCKPDDQPKEPDIVGIYTMHVKVNKRPPIINYDMGRPNPIPFDHQILYDEVMDTTQNICCPSKFASEHDCPMEYSIENVKIFKDGDQYYLQNTISYDLWGEQASFHVPLFDSGSTLVYDKATHPSIGNYFRNHIDMPSTGGIWPRHFDLLYFSVEHKTSHVLNGRWVFRDLLDDECRTHALMSDGKIHYCRMGEFAEFTLTKVE